MLDQPNPVPVRTIAVTIGMVLATVIALYLVKTLVRIEALLLIAAFFAVVLTPPVNWVHRRLRLRRGLSTLAVYLTLFAAIIGMLYLFIRPLVDESTQFADDLPTYVADARAGKGTIGKLVRRYKVDQWVEKNRSKIQQSVTRVGTGAISVVKSVAAVVALLLTVAVLAFMLILYGPDMLAGATGMLSPPSQDRIRAVGRDCAHAITGYVFGNLAISFIAGGVTYFSLLGLGVPFAGVLGLWVGFADLIPLIGATLGAIPTVGVAFLHSVTAGIVMVIIFIVYQQFENHVLQPVVMNRAVQLNQLFVLVAALAGVELFGLVGALLAIPAAGVIQVIVKDIYRHHRDAADNKRTAGTHGTAVSQLATEAVPPSQ